MLNTILVVLIIGYQMYLLAVNYKPYSRHDDWIQIRKDGSDTFCLCPQHYHHYKYYQPYPKDFECPSNTQFKGSKDSSSLLNVMVSSNSDSNAFPWKNYIIMAGFISYFLTSIYSVVAIWSRSSLKDQRTKLIILNVVGCMLAKFFVAVNILILQLNYEPGTEDGCIVLK